MESREGRPGIAKQQGSCRHSKNQDFVPQEGLPPQRGSSMAWRSRTPFLDLSVPELRCQPSRPEPIKIFSFVPQGPPEGLLQQRETAWPGGFQDTVFEQPWPGEF